MISAGDDLRRVVLSASEAHQGGDPGVPDKAALGAVGGLRFANPPLYGLNPALLRPGLRQILYPELPLQHLAGG